MGGSIIKHLIGLLCFLMLGCATINYIGESYPSTQDVDLYFSEEDIEQEYKVVGRVVATANSDELFYSSEKFTQAVLKKARENGADGVVIFGFGQALTGINKSGIRHRTKEEEKDNRTIISDIMNSSSSVVEKRRIEALAIKYKRNNE